MGVLRNSDGKPDAVFTMAVVAFTVAVLKFLVAGVTVAVGSYSLAFGDADSAAIAALLAPTLGAYVARRHTDATSRRRHRKEDGSDAE